MDRATRQLAAWKLKSLSKAVRLILLKSTLSMISVYAMQVVRLPSQTVKALERICREFFWGATAEKRALHTVA